MLKPVATAYRDVLPAQVRRGVGNFFGNLEDAWPFVNNALQLKGEAAADSLARFGVNTFFGVGGVLDVASEMRIEKHTKVSVIPWVIGVGGRARSLSCPALAGTFQPARDGGTSCGHAGRYRWQHRACPYAQHLDRGESH